MGVGMGGGATCGDVGFKYDAGVPFSSPISTEGRFHRMQGLSPGAIGTSVQRRVVTVQ